jgi:hypothetical protein
MNKMKQTKQTRTDKMKRKANRLKYETSKNRQNKQEDRE